MKRALVSRRLLCSAAIGLLFLMAALALPFRSGGGAVAAANALDPSGRSTETTSSLPTTTNLTGTLPYRVFLPLVVGSYNPVLDSTQAIVTPVGANLTLKNGITLVIPAGATSGPVLVQLAHLMTDTINGNAYLTSLQLEFGGAVGQASLVIPVAPGTRPDRPTTIFFAPGITVPVVLTGTVDTLENTYTVPLAGTAASLGANALGPLAGGAGGGTYNIEHDTGLRVTGGSALIPAPYYEQEGGNCWAATWLSYLATYSKATGDHDAIYELLARMNVEKNAGINCPDKTVEVNTAMGAMGAGGELNRWWSFQNFIDHVIASIDDGRPVYNCMQTHAGLFLGYEYSIDAAGKETIYLIYHDSETVKPQAPQGGPYRKVTTTQLRSEYWNTGTFVTVRGPALANAPVLQTIHLPDATVGGLASFKGLGFVKPSDVSAGRAIVSQALWDHTVVTEGYRITLDPVPSGIDEILLRSAKVWNTDDKAVAVTINTNLDAYVPDSWGDMKWRTLLTTSTVQTVPSNGYYRYTASFQARDMLETLLSTYPSKVVRRFRVVSKLLGSPPGPGFDVEFNHRPLYVKSVYPDATAGVGGQISVNGLGFGTTAGQVLINNTPAEIDVWNEAYIAARVGAGTTSGKLVVEVDGQRSLGIPFTVTTVINGFLPTQGPIGTQVVITGTSLGLITGTVTFSGTEASIDSWTDTEIRARVPDSIDGRSRYVTVAVGQAGSTLWSGDFYLWETIAYTIKHAPMVGATLDAWMTFTQIEGTWYSPPGEWRYTTTTPSNEESWSDTMPASSGGWSGTTFNGTTIYGAWQQDVTLVVRIDATNPLSASVSGEFRYWYTGTGPTPSVNEHRWTLDNLQMESYYDTYRWLVFRANGAAAAGPVASILRNYVSSTSSSSVNRSYVSTDWSNAAHPASVSVTFGRPQ